MVDFVLSTNPPNPKTSFRLGDWIRNLSCIGCGSQRSPSSPINPARPPISSPRFTIPVPPIPTPPPPPLPPPPNYASDSNIVLQKPSPHHPLLTPSGRAFAIGGKVQNISSDPLNPCIMFWPDNEPFPDQGQIRPSGLVGIPQPPILNTGNRGPISHQPGDWVCQKCNYLNWRRRKVCQTCLPYAEGNGDSISAAVQAERIALLTNVLARTRLDPSGNFQVPIHPTAAHPSLAQQPEQINLSRSAVPAQRSHSLTPPAERTGLGSAPALLEVSSSLGPSHPVINRLRPNGAVAVAQPTPGPTNRSVQRSRSHFALGQQYQQQGQEHRQTQLPLHLAPSPIYQTPLPLPGAPAFGPELLSPQQHFQNQHQQAQMHRNPSPLPVPLLYSTGPPTSPFLGASLETPGHRTRVLSSPAATAPKEWNASARDSVPVSSTPTSRSGSQSSLGSLRVRIGDSEGRSKAGDASGSEMPTPAINTPLLPAFLRDVVSSPSGSTNESGGERNVLDACIVVQSPTASEGDLFPESAAADVIKMPLPDAGPMHSKTNATSFPLTTMNLVTKPVPQFVPRTRNDSGSSTCSTSSSSSSLISSSTSGVSVSLSATSLSSESGCGGSGSNVNLMNGSMSGTPAPGPRSSSSSSSPTITTTVSLCSTPPADPQILATPGSNAVPTSASSLPFMSFGDGIWKLDGEESRSLKGYYGGHAPPPAQPNSHQAGVGASNVIGGQRSSKNGHGHHHGDHELQSTLPLPVGAERRMP